MHSSVSGMLIRATSQGGLWRRRKFWPTRSRLRISRSDGKKHDGATLIPWGRGKPLAWDVTVPDTYAASRTRHSWGRRRRAAANAATNKTNMPASTIHIALYRLQSKLTDINIEAAEFQSVLGTRISQITLDAQETQYLFKRRLSISLQRGN